MAKEKLITPYDDAFRIMISTLLALVRDGLLDLAEGSKRANMAQEEFARKVKDA